MNLFREYAHRVKIFRKDGRVDARSYDKTRKSAMTARARQDLNPEENVLLLDQLQYTNDWVTGTQHPPVIND